MGYAVRMIDKAEEMYESYETVISSLRKAIDALRAVNDDEAASEFEDTLYDVLISVKRKGAYYEQIVREAEKREEEQALRDYWRATV